MTLQAHRNVLGVLGMLLPILSAAMVLLFGDVNTLQSISHTHYSNAYILFEGLVFGTGLFLIMYRGYDIYDYWLTLVAGIAALVLVLFPTAMIGMPTMNIFMLPMNITGVIHTIAAGLFFLSLAVIIFWQFTKTGSLKNKMTKEKHWRNILYVICACIMILSLVIGFTVPFKYAKFFGEAFALWAYGIAWLTKGGVILSDKGWIE